MLGSSAACRCLTIVDEPVCPVARYQVLLRLNVIEPLPDLLLKPTKRRPVLRVKQMTRSTAVVI